MTKYLLIGAVLIAGFLIYHFSSPPLVSNVPLADPYADELAEFGNKLRARLEKGEKEIQLSQLLPSHEDKLYVCFHRPQSEPDWGLSFPATLSTDNFLIDVSLASDTKTGLPFITAGSRKYIFQLPDDAQKRIYCIGEENGSLRLNRTDDPQTDEILISTDETGYPPMRKP
ncbi:MAG: hypothetical protein IT560_01690 [Alphaproteobacteria bacterium]|nr:hypothetical protein [Alphaproteobacteria bacterium]